MQRLEDLGVGRDDGLLHHLPGIPGIAPPPHLAHVGRLHEQHGELTHLLRASSLAGPQHEAVAPVVGEDAAREPHDVPGLEGFALGAPQHEMHGRRLVGHQRHARLLPTVVRVPVGLPGRLVEHDERGVHGVGRRRDEVLELHRRCFGPFERHGARRDRVFPPPQLALARRVSARRRKCLSSLLGVRSGDPPVPAFVCLVQPDRVGIVFVWHGRDSGPIRPTGPDLVSVEPRSPSPPSSPIRLPAPLPPSLRPSQLRPPAATAAALRRRFGILHRLAQLISCGQSKGTHYSRVHGYF